MLLRIPSVYKSVTKITSLTKFNDGYDFHISNVKHMQDWIIEIKVSDGFLAGFDFLFVALMHDGIWPGLSESWQVCSDSPALIYQCVYQIWYAPACLLLNEILIVCRYGV